MKITDKIKAIAKILGGVVIASLLGSFVSVIIVFATGAGVLGMALGILVMLGITALGAFIGGKWARNNVAETESTRNVAVWSSIIFFAANLILLAASSVITAVFHGEKMGFWIQAAQVAAQSFVIYAASQTAMRRKSIKKTQDGNI
ncbi:MAG: hypothetical protein WC519_00325 [Parcubacteria group bacterium]